MEEAAAGSEAGEVAAEAMAAGGSTAGAGEVAAVPARLGLGGWQRA